MSFGWNLRLHWKSWFWQISEQPAMKISSKWQFLFSEVQSLKWRTFANSAHVSRCVFYLTHWGRVTHICVSKLIIIDRRQAIICTNAGLLSIGPLRTYFSENLIKIQQFSLKKIRVKMSSAKWRPSCLGLSVLSLILIDLPHISYFTVT